MQTRVLILLSLCLALTGFAEQQPPVTVVGRLIADYASVKTVRCDIRRETRVEGRRVKTLSRVWYQRPDRLRVETVTPEPRRIIVDGTNIYKWIEGQDEGVRIPLAEASAAELMQVRKVPGSPEDYLLRLQGVPEVELPASAQFPVRCGYAAEDPKPYAELSLGEDGRLAQVELFASPMREDRLVRVLFRNWREPAPGIVFPCLQQTTLAAPGGKTIHETVRVSALSVNEAFDGAIFDVGEAVSDVHFMSVAEMTARLAEREKK